MTEEIDVKKLTKDAFTAIDALFTDEDDMLPDENEKQPDDFYLIQEYMLAIEWECSDKNIRKFSSFLDKITPKYGGKHNQDMLKMLTSIVRYLDKSKEKALPETHNVMESIVKTFKNINQNGIDEETIKQQRNAAYNKVLDLKSRIAKVKTEVLRVAEVRGQESLSTSQPSVEQIESSQIVMRILARLELCENRLAAIDSQNMKLQQQIGELTYLNNQMGAQINALDLKLSDQINEMSHLMTSQTVNSDVAQAMDNLSFAAKDEEQINQQYDEINFDGLDFNEMISSTDRALDSSGIDIQPDEMEMEFDQVEFDQIELDEIEPNSSMTPEPPSRFEIDFEQINPDTIKIEELFDESLSSEEITIDDLKYDEITIDDLKYDEKVSPGIESHEKSTPLDFSELEDKKKQSDSDDKDISALIDPVDVVEDAHIENTPQYARCFKIEDQIIAFPEDKIYNIYRIPSKLSKNIHHDQSILLGQFASFSQSLSKNMNGHLKEVNGSILKQMKVDIHLLTSKEIQYNMAVLCSFDDKMSIIPVTDAYGEKSHLFTDLKDGKNSFSDYNVNIADIGATPFVPLCKR